MVCGSAAVVFGLVSPPAGLRSRRHMGRGCCFRAVGLFFVAAVYYIIGIFSGFVSDLVRLVASVYAAGDRL